MNNRRKWYSVALVGVIVLLLMSFVACNGGEEVTPTPTETPAETATPVETVQPTATPEKTMTPVETATPTEEPGGAPLIPVDHFASGCTACHETGAGGASEWPEDHADFTDATCSACHAQAE
ncbi:MAG: hypothetical protein SVO26_02395 [Chloroflexota bacterium]|nr:hypothetical protein [Chloroflexota bacterium]